MFNIKFCVLLVVGTFLGFSTPVLGESCEINITSTQFEPYDMGGMSLFTMPEYLYTVTFFLINILLSPALSLIWVLTNIELFIILFAFYSLLFTKELRNHNVISLLLALYFLYKFINNITTELPNTENFESFFIGGFFGIILNISRILMNIILGVVYIISFSSIMVKMFFIITKALNPEKKCLIKINFRNKIKEHKNLINLLPDFISFYLVYGILKNPFLLQGIFLNINRYNIFIIFTFFLLIANILIKRIME